MRKILDKVAGLKNKKYIVNIGETNKSSKNKPAKKLGRYFLKIKMYANRKSML
jgi:hypothetical protein